MQTDNTFVRKYGDKSAFMMYFNPNLQSELCPHRDVCFFGDYPTLAAVRNGYSGKTDMAWLVAQITNLSEYCGSKGKITEAQLLECASIIAGQYYFLKVSELMLFFYLFKSGKYGRFYGSVDPMIITAALREFMYDRGNAISAHDSAIAQKKYESDKKHAIPSEQYEQLKKIDNEKSI